MNEVQNKATQLRDAIVAEFGDSEDVVCQIPGWQPVALPAALRWVEVSVCEGFYVAYRVDRSVSPATLQLKKWEFGEDEPSWTP